MYRYVIVLLLLLFVPCSESGAQEAEEKLLKRQTLKKIRKNIGINQKKGFIPMDLAVTGKGRFTVRMEKPFQDFLWEIEFDQTDEEFEKNYVENHARQLRLVVHEQYELKKKNLHACLWHYDPNMRVPTEEQLNDEANRPGSQPLGNIWSPGAKIPVVGLQGGPYHTFENKVIEYMRATQMPAISVAFAVGGKPVYVASFGYSDLSRLKPATPESAFRTVWGSRLFTAIATLQLVEKGALKLDDPVYPLLGYKPWRKDTVDPRLDKVTIKQLLQMTGGHDPNLTKDPLFQHEHIAKEMKIKGEVTAKHAIEFMMSQPLAYEPGSKRVGDSHYSYFLLGQVIAKVSGMSYEDYVLENIAKPAKMKTLAMSQTDQTKRPAVSVRHYEREGRYYKTIAGSEYGKWGLVDDGRWNFGLLNSSYGWLASPTDMLALGTALQADPSPLLSRDSKKILVAAPDYQMQGSGPKRTTWSGMGLAIRMAKKKGDMDFWMESRGTSSTHSLICYASGDQRCFMMNCVDTADGSSTYRSFAPVASEGFEVAVKLHRQ